VKTAEKPARRIPHLTRVPSSSKSSAGHLAARRFDLRIVEETDAWIVVDKPPLIEAHPSKPGGARTLWDGLRDLLAYEIANGGQVSIINRLDRETSGLTLIAKDRATARAFSRQMAARTIEKQYLAICLGLAGA
jgi:23S rRNA pseudouridine1911/1915/1917 synthase